MKSSFSFLLQNLTFIISTFFILTAHANTTGQSIEEIAEHIAPVGKVCIQGQPCQPSEKALQVVANTQTTPTYTGREPKKIYNTYCIACHASGAAGAPRLGKAKEWAPHIAKGMDTLLKDAIKGIGAMPPRGICSDCTDDELKRTIQYMIDKSQ